MKKVTTSLIVAAFLISTYAQQTTFRIQYNLNQMDMPSGITQNTSGNYIFSSTITGLSIPLGTQGGLTEVNPNGVHVRTSLYRNGSFSTDVDLQDVKNAGSGSYIVTGSSGGQCLVAKFPSTLGAPTWQYRFIPGSGSSAYGNKVIPTSDGGYLVVGSANHISNGIVMTDSSKMFALKTDASGGMIWMKTFFSTTAFDDDDYLTDATEVSDGYVLVGWATVVAGDGQSDAIVIKVDKTSGGNLQWARRFGSGNSEDVQSVITDAGNTIIMTGIDNLGAYIYNWDAPNSGPSVTGTNTRYYSAGLPVSSGNLTKTADGNIALFASGATLENFTPIFTSILFKANKSTGAPMFARSYNSVNSILPTGIQAADSGFLINSLSADTINFSGYDFGITKTDINGLQGSAGCQPSNVTVLYQNYSPSINTLSPVVVTTAQRNSGNLTASSPTPTTVIVCRSIACTPPPTPSLSANPTTICSGQSTTLSASGGSNVTYRYYTQASGGVSIGTGATLTVSPASTTTYYVESDDNNNPGCVSSRASVTVTVNQLPGNVGSITGAASPCISTQNYFISSVTGATSYSWAVSGGQTISGSGTNASVNWTTPGGPYTITVTATNSCGNSTATLNVNVLSNVSGVSAASSPVSPVCSGTNVILQGSGSNVTAWAWTGPNGYTASVQSPVLNNIQANQAGTYTLTATNGCGNASASVSLTINTTPQSVSATANPNPACVGNTLQLNGSATGATSWSWLGPNGFSANTQNTSKANVQTNDSGIYTLTATNTCGNSTATVDVTVNDVPAAVAAAANPTAVCPGASLSLSGSATGAVSYSWTGPNNFSSTQLNNTVNNFQSANAGTYTLTATNACGSAQNSVAVTISSGPVNTTATANFTNICSSSSLSLTGTSTGATSWNWTGPNGFSSPQQNPVINPVTLADSGLYTLTATNICGTATATVNVDVDTVIQNLSGNASPDDSVCSGSTVTLQGSGTQVNSWSWTGPNGFSSTQQNPVLSNLQTASSGVYTLTVSNACGNQTVSVNLLVSNPIASLSASSTTSPFQCSGSDINLTATGNNVTNWSWTGPNGFVSTQQNPTISGATTAASGTYTLTATNGCGTQTATIEIQIDTLIQNVTATASPEDTICAGGTISLNANGTNVTSWNWSGPNGFTSNQQNTSIPSATNSASGTYTLIASNSCGNSQASLNVLVNNPIQNLSATATNNGVVCSQSSVTLSAAGNNVNSWSWTGPDNFSSNQQNPQIDPAFQINSGTYTVIAYNACGNQSATVTLQVDTAIRNLSAAAAPNDTICAGGTISLNANGTNVTSWNWSGPNGFTSNQQNVTINNAQDVASGTYILTGSNACGNVTATIQVLVKTVPSVSLNIQGQSTVCGNTTGTYTVNSSSAVTAYNWAVTGGSISGGQGTNSINVNWGTTAGAYQVSVTASNECGNGSSSSLAVIVDVPTVLGITATNDTVCYNTSTELTATAAPSSSIITWYLDPVGGTEIGHGATFTTDNLTQTTTFFAQATSVNGCQNLQGRVPATVTVTPLPVVTLVSDKDGNNNFPTAFSNEVINFTAVPDSFDSYEFFWNGSSVQIGSLNTWSSSKIENMDSVWVAATFRGCAGKRDIDTIRIVDFPNAFTPNNDGVNDIFLAGYDLLITNRWGQTLYQGREGWDGKYKGEKVSPGTYYYVVMLDNITDRKNAIKGTVLLIEE